ncbi:MAG: hypothetical protein ACKOEM_10570 [Planctomycetia bacterium]
MPLYRLMLEDHRNVVPATVENVEAAIRKLASSTGPTFLNLKDEGGNWAQAGGTNGRYRVEVRDIYGEGFQHWMAALPGCTDRSATIVYYRNKCIENEHAYRRCPLEATVANVLGLEDVMLILTEYGVTGQRSSKYLWDDISQDWMDDEVAEKGLGIKVIKPKGDKGKHA